jgi:hypothetical protein
MWRLVFKEKINLDRTLFYDRKGEVFKEKINSIILNENASFI